MKIWIDFINTPQVSFFEGIVNRLIREGHDVILTCRDSSNTVDLLELTGWNYNIINGYSGKNTFLKYLMFPLRLARLFLFIKRKHVDVSICQSSFYLPLVSWLLGIPSIYTNDNEHARGNLIGFLFAKRVFLPEPLRPFLSRKRLPVKRKFQFYPGVKEGIYLSGKEENLPAAKSSGTSVFFRPEPMTAQYYNGPLFQHDELLVSLAQQVSVTIIPRGVGQLEHYKDIKFRQCTVLEKAIDFKTIVRECDVFIGGGGSMTRELAVLGKKVISTYAGELLAVDRYLIELGLMQHILQPDVQSILRIVDKSYDDSIMKASKMLLDKGILANKLLYSSVFEINIM
jgi:predicted glycosyltransferase